MDSGFVGRQATTKKLEAGWRFYLRQTDSGAGSENVKGGCLNRHPPFSGVPRPRIARQRLMSGGARNSDPVQKPGQGSTRQRGRDEDPKVCHRLATDEKRRAEGPRRVH